MPGKAAIFSPAAAAKYGFDSQLSRLLCGPPPFISSQPVLLPGRHVPCHEEEAGRQGVLCQEGREQDFEEGRRHEEAGEGRGFHATRGGGALVQRAADEVEAPRRPGGILGGRGAEAKKMTVMVVDPDADIEKRAGMVTVPAIRQCTFRGALVAERL